MFTERLDVSPDLLALHAADRAHFPYLLMSSGEQGWDMLFALPGETRLFHDGEGGAFLDAVRAITPQPVDNPQRLPFVGGWFVFLGYDLLSEFEPSVPAGVPDSFPLAALARVPAAVLIDRAAQQSWLVAESAEELATLRAKVGAAVPFVPRPVVLESLSEDDPSWYTDAVVRLKRYIVEGDVFQVNISRGWRATLADSVRAITPQAVDNPQRLPFVGGWFLFLGYDLLSEFEPSVPAGVPDSFPLAALARVPAAVLVDRAAQQGWLVAESAEALAVLRAKVTAAVPFVPRPVALESLSEDEPSWYTDAVVRLKRYIVDGDVFQVNISRGWRATLAESVRATDLFAALRRANPAPFSALADFGEAQIVSSSPERLVRVKDGWAETRPIAG
ncbi:MAG TPA: chorismate-binding protein, partial [Pseudogulbenkiania sp.]|nr:chorismate-binding protein [Pseudogulbenkiania sp.]